MANEYLVNRADLTAVADSIRGKTGKSDSLVFPNDFVSEIDSITGGSEPVPYDGEYLVRVIDYDGTILKEDYLNTGDTFTLPDPPTNDRLTFQTWSSPVDIVDNTVTVTDDNIIIGACYDATRPPTEIDISINENTGLTFKIYNCTGLSELDWGDGTIESADKTIEHTYAEAGEYTIKATGITSFNAYPFTNGTGSETNYNYMVKKLFIPNNIILEAYSLYNLINCECIVLPTTVTSLAFIALNSLSLKAMIIPPNVTKLNNRIVYQSGAEIVVIPKGVTSMGNEAVGNCSFIDKIVIPNTVTTLGTNVLAYCFDLKTVKLPNSITTIGSDFCKGNASYSIIQEIIFGENITSIGANFLQNNTRVRLLDFSKAKQVPTLGGTIPIKNTACRILVPSALYDEWIAATNWADVAQYIFPVKLSETFDFSAQGYETTHELTNIITPNNGFRINFEKGSETASVPKYNVNINKARLYDNNTVSFSRENTYLTEIVFNGVYLENLSVNVGNFTVNDTGTVGTWVGLANEVVFTTTTQAQIQTITIKGE